MITPIDTVVLTALNTIKTGTYHDVYDWIVYQWWFNNAFTNIFNNAFTNIHNIIPDDTVMMMIMSRLENKNLIEHIDSMAYGPDGKLHTVYQLTTTGYNQLMSMTDSYDFYFDDSDPYVKVDYDNVPVDLTV